MPSFYRGKIPIITGSLDQGFIRGTPDVEPATGCIPRDYDIDPVAMGDSPAAMEIIPLSEWKARWDEAEKNEDSLEHILCRTGKPAYEILDQNGHGYCWAYSTGNCIMQDRLKQNLEPIRINPHATAAIIKGGRDEGGWCGLSMKWAREHGYAVEGTDPGEWPLHSRNLKYDTPELRKAMALHKAEEDWYDLGKKEWDQTMARSQLITCSFNNSPMALDFNRYSHSMNCPRVVQFEKNAWGPLVYNSWVGWGWNGLAVLAEIWPDNAVALRASTPSDR